MPAHRALKALGALLLLVALALPLSTCTRHVDSAGQSLDLVDRQDWPADVREVVRYRYPLAHGGWLPGLAFVWPLVALAVLEWQPKGRVAVTVRVVEPPLVLASLGYIDFLASFLSTRAVGAYWAYCALGLYAIGATWSDIVAYRSWRGARATGS